MTLGTDGIAAIITVTAQALIQIPGCRATMRPAIGFIRPAGAVMRFRIDHLCPMAIDTIVAILVTCIALLFVAFGVEAMIVDKIEWMGFSIQVGLLVALEAGLIGVAQFAVILGNLFGDRMRFAPIQPVIRRPQGFTPVVAIVTISGFFQITVA